MKLKISYVLGLGACSFFLLWLSLALYLTFYQVPSPTVVQVRTLVVLGAGYYKDGHPVPALEARLKTAFALWRSLEPRPALIVSGRQEEVHVMKKYLAAAGIPLGNIIEDTQGTNTAATVRGLRGVEGTNAFVSQAYHLMRVRLYAEAYGVEGIYVPSHPVPIGFFQLFPLAARESLAVFAFPFQYLFFREYK